MSAVPEIAIAHEACAFMYGAAIYGPFNWRDKPIVARIYVDAAKRHIGAWLEGEEVAPDSGVHHLGHARACLALILDAETNGTLVDDRPLSKGFSESMSKLTKWAADRVENASRTNRTPTL